jgi:transposase InsO family protein
LRSYATKHPCHGFRRAWAARRYGERREVNEKKIHRLWREEGLQVKIRSPRKRAGVSSIPSIEADAPNVVWAIDFQFDSTVDGKAIKIASMIDEHTRAGLERPEPTAALADGDRPTSRSFCWWALPVRIRA